MLGKRYDRPLWPHLDEVHVLRECADWSRMRFARLEGVSPPFEPVHAGDPYFVPDAPHGFPALSR